MRAVASAGRPYASLRTLEADRSLGAQARAARAMAEAVVDSALAGFSLASGTEVEALGGVSAGETPAAASRGGSRDGIRVFRGGQGEDGLESREGGVCEGACEDLEELELQEMLSQLLSASAASLEPRTASARDGPFRLAVHEWVSGGPAPWDGE